MSDSPYIFVVDELHFAEQVVQQSFKVPVLVDFWAEWCAPCKALMPVLSKLAKEYQGQFLLAKINTDEQRQLATQFNIRSIPTLKLFRNGQVVEEVMGAQPEQVIRALIDRYRERPADKLRLQAMEAYQQGQVNRAMALLEKAQEMEPSYYLIQLDIARILIAERKLLEAEQIIKGLPANVQTEADTQELFIHLNFFKVIHDAPPLEELTETLVHNPHDHRTRYQLGAYAAINGDYNTAMEHFLELMRQNRQFEDDAGRKSLLAVFTLLGNKGEWVSRYRSKMSSLLH